MTLQAYSCSGEAVIVKWLLICRAVLISHFLAIRLIDYFFFDVYVFDSIMLRALVLGKVWWGPDQHHVNYIA